MDTQTPPKKSIAQMQQDLLKFRASKLGTADPTATPAAPTNTPVQTQGDDTNEAIGASLAAYRKDRSDGKTTTAVPKEDPNALAEFAKGIFGAPATMVARPFQAAAEIAGASADQVDAATKKIPLFGGLVAPVPQDYKDVQKDVGRGVETVALGTGAPIAGGALFGAGASLEAGNDLLSAQTAVDTAIGAGGGKVLDWIGKPLLNVAGKVVGTITPKIIKDVAAGGAEAIAKFAATHDLPLVSPVTKPLAGAIERGTQAVDTAINAGLKKGGSVLARTAAEQFPGLDPVQHYLNVNKTDVARPSTVNDPQYAQATAVYNDAKAHGVNIEDVANERGIQHDKLVGEGGKYNTKDTANALTQKVYTEWNKPYRAAIKQVEAGVARVPTTDVKTAIEKKIQSLPSSQVNDDERAAILRDVERKYGAKSEAAKAHSDGYSLTNLHDSRIESAGRVKYKQGISPDSIVRSAKLARIEESTFRDLFDSSAPKDAEFDGVRREFEKNLRLANYLRSLHGKKVPAGVLKKATRLFGKAVGATLGGKIGGFAGFLAGGQFGDMLFRSFEVIPNPIKGAILDRLEQEEPKAFEALRKHLGAQEAARLQRKALPAPGTSSFKEKKPTLFSGADGRAYPSLQEAIDTNAVGSEMKGSSLTKEAQDLLNKIDVGGSAPAFISNSLKKIASDNGVAISDSMTPNDVISALRKKNVVNKTSSVKKPDTNRRLRSYLDKVEAAQTNQGPYVPPSELPVIKTGPKKKTPKSLNDIL